MPPKKQSVRLMAPFAMHCLECRHFIYKGTKFNARKKATGQDYLGIAIIGFDIRCPRCGSEIFFRTDPKTSDYIVETGAARNLEPWRQKELETESIGERLDRLEDEQKEKEVDPLTKLEESTRETAREAARERQLLSDKKKADAAQIAASQPPPELEPKPKAKLDLNGPRPRAVLPTIPKKKKPSRLLK